MSPSPDPNLLIPETVTIKDILDDADTSSPNTNLEHSRDSLTIQMTTEETNPPPDGSSNLNDSMASIEEFMEVIPERKTLELN